jgi:phosphorylcholine metabolism protein LicD
MDANKIQELLNNLFPHLERLIECWNNKENEAYDILINNDTLCAFWLGVILASTDDELETRINGLELDIEKLNNAIQLDNNGNIIKLCFNDGYYVSNGTAIVKED